jgi:uncharacterized SAM-binding protein YcdF (DUF218 family)
MLIVTFTPVVGWWTQALTGPWPDAKGDTLIVLGANQGMGGVLGFSSYWRAAYAVAAWKSGHWQRVIASGHGVAIPMKNFLVAGGVPREDIILEDHSTTTRENALECAKILKTIPGRNVLLTSDFHMFRAIRTFRKAGINVQPLPIPDAGKRAAGVVMRWSAFLDLTIESSKIVYYFARGWI